MRNKAAAFWLALLMVFGGGITIYFAARGQFGGGGDAGDADTPPVKVTESGSRTVLDSSAKRMERFTLTRQDGTKFDSQEMDGHIWVTNFFFASCPHSCQTLMMRVKKLQEEFGPQGAKFVSITCDPADDTAAVLEKYAKGIGADTSRWSFLTGDIKQINKIGRHFYQMFVDEEQHNDYLVIIDRAGKIRGHFDSTNPTSYGVAKRQLGRLLLEDPPAAPHEQAHGPAAKAAPTGG